ncbi:MAG: peptidoglycan DD-metalloendopeptidase family protein [Gammaproteobacteria bacterium]|nr:peptidoglycan DD-metalloendopeptidase family protein [Gammaproteobacteria bacterium]
MMRLLVFVFFLIGYYASESHALELPQSDTVPGGVAILEIGEAEATKPEARFGKKKVMVVANAGKWLAVVGLPLDLKPGRHTIDIRLEGYNDWRPVAFEVDDKRYTEQRLTIKNKRKVDPNEEDMKKIREDNSKIARAKRTWTETVKTVRFDIPATGIRSSEFGLRRFFNDQPRRPHGGIDIAAPQGTPVYAPADGVVTEADDFFFSGNCIFIDHGQGLTTFYAHLSKIDVKPGQTVEKGQKIAEIGETGRVTGPHLHWSVGLNQTWVDPDLFLNP